jgi:hypothetical protein
MARDQDAIALNGRKSQAGDHRSRKLDSQGQVYVASATLLIACRLLCQRGSLRAAGEGVAHAGVSCFHHASS